MFTGSPNELLRELFWWKFDKIDKWWSYPPATQDELARRCGQGLVVKMYYTYVLLSEKDGKLYVGCTRRLNVRLGEHNDGKVSATKSRRPLVLIYFEGCLNEAKAFRREKYFKTGFGRKYLKERI